MTNPEASIPEIFTNLISEGMNWKKSIPFIKAGVNVFVKSMKR
jgi:hypothetical protein